ncbi:unnamed protein product [Protopolystoma xenopodis]|uniref:Uncharacterized protein n=1 Tax=Protopolystoma xenopodis TaxID=117903 RepID=A0A448WIV5_9PLAT|nr:unnamed protein product [Protopolystoma xenopodis]
MQIPTIDCPNQTKTSSAVEEGARRGVSTLVEAFQAFLLWKFVPDLTDVHLLKDLVAQRRGSRRDVDEYVALASALVHDLLGKSENAIQACRVGGW